MNNYGSKFQETELLLAVANDDEDTAYRILDDMLPASWIGSPRMPVSWPRLGYGDPDFSWRVAEMFQADGTALAEAILERSPGGTIDACLAVLLARRASLFRVKFPQEAA
jgi:hypothetical protein